MFVIVKELRIRALTDSGRSLMGGAVVDIFSEDVAPVGRVVVGMLMKSSRGNTAACQLKLFLALPRHPACNLLEDGMRTLLKNAPIRYGAVRGDDSENATEFWVDTLISYRLRHGTATQWDTCHNFIHLYLCRLSQLLTRFIVTDNAKN